jgi:hypothetical protein
LKQSAIVFATLKTGTPTPSISCLTMPSLNEASDIRVILTAGESIRGAAAFDGTAIHTS